MKSYQKLLFIIPIFIISTNCTQIKNSSENDRPSEYNSLGITSEIVTKHIKTLSSDEMNGRGAFSEDIKKAESYIADQMKFSGLTEFSKFPGYKHTFNVYSSVPKISYKINGTEVKTIVVNSSKSLSLNNMSESKLNNDFNVLELNTQADYRKIAGEMRNADSNTWIWVDKELERYVSFLGRSLSGRGFEIPVKKDFLVIAAFKPDGKINSIDLDVEFEVVTDALTNTIGYIEGTDPALKDEYIVFSGHHDHLGFRENDTGPDKIYNGANDNASGVTAVLSLAKHFVEKGDNKRSLVFMTFTAEEAGGYGSRRMLLDMPFTAEDVVAMVNIEMIGTTSIWGPRKAWLTGWDRSDLGLIYQEAITDTSFFNVYPDPYPNQRLFFRSDNASFAMEGIPAHTFSTTDLPNDKNYHQPSDEFETMIIDNILETIKGIAVAARTIISGERTPTRVTNVQR